MRRTPVILAALVAAALVMSPAANADRQDGKYSDEDIIEYRRHIMKALHEQSAILGQIVSFSVPNDNVIAHLETLSLLASAALRSFEPEVQGGEAKPEVWSDWPDFSKRMKEFAERTRQATENAKEHGKEGALANILDVLSCKDCHEVYRKEQE